MNQLSNLNATIVKEVKYDATLQPAATTINFTVENCHVNSHVDQIIFYLNSADANFGNQVVVELLDRGNGYAQPINGFVPTTFASFGSGQVTSGGTNVSNLLTQNGTTVVTHVNQSVQDSEGIGNIYVKLTRANGTFNVGFTMVVIYRPEITYNSKLNTRNQVSDVNVCRVLSQTGSGTYLYSTMADQTNFVAHNVNPRNNTDIATFGFNVTSTNPVFYFGSPEQTKRWFIGFSSDNTPNIGSISFSYFDGNNFIGFAATQYAMGCLGPGTYQGAYDGVVVFTPPVSWSPIKMNTDPLTVYNQTMIGLGTLASNNIVRNPSMYWVRCQVGFSSTQFNQTLTVSTVVPLIDPALSLTYKRKLI